MRDAERGEFTKLTVKEIKPNLLLFNSDLQIEIYLYISA